METERVGRAGPTRLLFVQFRDGGDVVGYPLGHAPPAASMWRGVFFGMLFCTTAVVVETRNANDSDGGGNGNSDVRSESGDDRHPDSTGVSSRSLPRVLWSSQVDAMFLVITILERFSYSVFRCSSNRGLILRVNGTVAVVVLLIFSVSFSPRLWLSNGC